MPTDPFVILGLDKSASQSEILEAYKAKRKYYSDHIFDEGEAGADAARMLEQLENAYQSAMEYTHSNATISDDPQSTFEDVKQAVLDKDLEKAQRLLDSMTYRGGEWHYYQSIIFYEKSWLAESKKQLEIALELDPGNEKYSRALNKLKNKIDGAKPFGAEKKERSNNTYSTAGADTTTQRTYQQNTGADAADGCCAACQALWCADCCCECMGGDLISCC